MAKAAADLSPYRAPSGQEYVALRDVVAEVALEDIPSTTRAGRGRASSVLNPRYRWPTRIRLALALVQAKLGDRAAVGAAETAASKAPPRREASTSRPKKEREEERETRESGTQGGTPRRRECATREDKRGCWARANICEKF